MPVQSIDNADLTALRSGSEVIAAERHFEIGDAGLIDITALRKAGYTLQPY